MPLDAETLDQSLTQLEQELAFTSIDFFRRTICGYQDFGDFHHELDQAWQFGKRFKLILIPRNHLKSSWCMAWLASEILRNPDVSILYETAIYEQGRKYVGEIQRHIEGKEWHRLFGDWRGVPWAAGQFTVNRRKVSQPAPTVSASGLDKTQTGQHYDIIVLDDLVNEHNYRTPEGRQKAIDRFKQARSLLRPGGRMIVIGTPWDRADLYGFIQKHEDLFSLFSFVHMSVYKPDGSIRFPARFVRTNKELEGRNGVESLESLYAMDPYGFSCQYLCKPDDALEGEFKPEWLRHCTMEEALRALREDRGHIYVFVDPALGKENTKEPCDTGLIVAHATTNHKLHILFADGELITPFEAVDRADELAEYWGADEVCVEAIAFQEVVATMLDEKAHSNNRNYNVRRVQPRHDKERRIRSLFGYYQAGHIVHVESLRDGKLEDQLRRFPKERLRDVADALSQFCYVGAWPVQVVGESTIEQLKRAGFGVARPFSQRAPKDKKAKPKAAEQSYLGGRDSIFSVG